MKAENGPICKRRNAAKFLSRTKEAGKITPWDNFGQCEGFSQSFTRWIEDLDAVKKQNKTKQKTKRTKKKKRKKNWEKAKLKETIGEFFLDMDDLSVADAGLDSDGDLRSYLIWKCST